MPDSLTAPKPVEPETRLTAFDGVVRIASGSVAEVADVVRAASRDGASPILVFDDATGRAVDIDLRSDYRLTDSGHQSAIITVESRQLRPRGRPKLGVVAREVTLLPRHWEWLSKQPGGASVALRELVDEARRTTVDRDDRRARQTAAFHFMSAIAGNLPGFEEASRALFAENESRFRKLIADWPVDIRDHASRLAFGDSTAHGA